MKRIVIAITGASAMQLGERSIQLLLENDKSVDLILSKGAYEVAKSERNINIPVEPKAQSEFWRNKLRVESGDLNCYRWNDHSASIASGSHKTKGMVIVPCSMGTLGRIASGFSLDLIERCADVHLKENRPLIISPRESPFNLIHIENIKRVATAGAIIVPPIPAWYTNPKSIEDIIDFIVVRLFDSLGEDLDNIKRWVGPNK
ncbi:flavin prenyltransferase UbiX [Prochlorococcus marinus]|uniref:Flavin prenyltransferase UbiX n=1 Tax=Prochlorococcus marinus XMU1408 TaxID=2213228 RepID=A0A318R1I9_PROMR|nr:flavin prenyltransferase UbiX [Prochlorococcus marinus]MBW3041993.1 amino acid decarboxylase [Prochlorococcus marinus str. XMU1408]PYE03116.1 amino acid decarboxylase [Prochlorococcus marinus XMU1408]